MHSIRDRIPVALMAADMGVDLSEQTRRLLECESPQSPPLSPQRPALVRANTLPARVEQVVPLSAFMHDNWRTHGVDAELEQALNGQSQDDKDKPAEDNNHDDEEEEDTDCAE